MTALLVKLAIRALIFGAVIGGCAAWLRNVKIRPPWALPVVALVFAVLNSVLYHLLFVTMMLLGGFLLFIVVPFVANAILLWGTKKLVRWLEIESLFALLLTSGALTIAHVVLRLFRL